MSDTHFPFFVNVTSLSLDALECFMIIKSYLFKTAQTLGANIYHSGPGFNTCVDQKSGVYDSGESK